jgi:signal transduction histidine kinase
MANNNGNNNNHIINCFLVKRTGIKPFKRCQYCEMQMQECFGIQFFVIGSAILALLTTVFFISDLPALVFDIMILIILLVALLAYLASQEINQTILNNVLLKRINKELKEAEKQATLKAVELQKSNEEQIKINQMKNEFLGIINHELKEPITAVISGMDIFRAHGISKLNESQLKILNIIDKSGQDMLRLTNNLIELSKIEFGKIEIYPEFSPLFNLIEEVILSIKPEADKKKIKITINIDDPTTTVFADPQKLKQVLFNLIDNAVKYTPEKGSVHIDVKSSDSDTKIEVKDTGIGIKKENLDTIFNKFTKHVPGYKGTGLGLYISKSFVEAHNGRIEVESEYGKGTVFRVELPKVSPN